MTIYNEEKLKTDKAMNFGREYQRCSISLMDTIADPKITFNDEGVCNYYFEYKTAEKKTVLKGEEGRAMLQMLTEKIKYSGIKKNYDCITGVSGGVDSTFLALQAKKLGLRPLIVHFDNGWNSELSVSNITNIINKLGYDLYTLVVDWNEFRDIQLSYLKASVVDIEAVTDHAILGTLYRLAVENNIKYILSGTNVVTEQVLPSHWIWNKGDDINIKDIHRKFGTVQLKTYPFFNSTLKHYYQRTKGIEVVSLLNCMPYEKRKVKEIITEELGWRDYGGKHYESIFTRFYQGFILPNKFGIDKRKAHLSNLIFAGQLTKEEALFELAQPIYDPKQLNSDYEFVLKKLGLSNAEFNSIMAMPRREHTDFLFEKNNIWDNYPILKPMRGIWRKLKGARGERF